MFRAIAIIAVVMIHTTPAGQWQVFCKPFINFAVAAFIFLSGYLTKTDNDNWLKFYVRRITRVLVPYIIWTVIYSIPDIRSSGPSVSSSAMHVLPLWVKESDGGWNLYKSLKIEFSTQYFRTTASISR